MNLTYNKMKDTRKRNSPQASRMKLTASKSLAARFFFLCFLERQSWHGKVGLLVLYNDRLVILTISQSVAFLVQNVL